MNITNNRAYLTGRNGSGLGVTPGVTPMSFPDYGRHSDKLPDTLLGREDYATPTILHNNMGSSSLLTQTIDNCLFIDSQFRNTGRVDSSNDTFNFKIQFGQDYSNTNEYGITYNGNKYKYTRYSGKAMYKYVSMPYKYDNIEYITIDTLILPLYTDYITNEDGSITECCERLSRRERFIVLKINELRSERKVSNNPNIGDDAFIMKLEDDSCCSNELYVPIHSKVTFFKSTLKTLDTLTIEVCDDNGVPLQTTLDGEYVNFNKMYHDCIKEMEKLIKSECTNEEKLCYLENKLKSLKCIADRINPQLHMTVYTLNTQLNTLPNFGRG
jgi:hypothetical protein